MKIIHQLIGFLAFVSFAVLVSCTSIPSDVKYTVISEVKNDSINKVNVDIQLNKKVTEEVLGLIGEKLKADLKLENYSKIWMFYYLPDMKVGSGAWATTHFTPGIEIKILGATQNQTDTSVKKADEVVGKIIGKWKEDQYTNAVYVIYENNNQTIIRTLFANGQKSDDQLKSSKESSSTRYDYKSEGFNGEYFKVNANNELEFYNKENKLFTKGLPLK
ncbi:MAG: hypothetical protein Q8M08_15700 [Bacteroidales bacterium]|nr:hypothetical protein [Bacteroidales bacterium]